jgi:hypothetical protein
MASAELPAVPREGVSLAALRAFCAQHAGRTFAPSAGEAANAARSGDAPPKPLPFEALTTTQVCERAIKPATAATGLSYAEQLLRAGATDEDGRPHVAPATCFLSHAWSYKYADLVAAVDAKFEGDAAAASVYLWNGARRAPLREGFALRCRRWRCALAPGAPVPGCCACCVCAGWR